METGKDQEQELELEGETFELDSDEAEDLESAMREALEAVEAGGKEQTAGREAGAEPEIETSDKSPDEVEIHQVEAVTRAAVEEPDELDGLRQEVAELRDRSVRTLADFDNFRKRVERERDEQRRYAGFDTLREVLTIVDNLERALESDGELEDLRQGVELILRQLDDLLRRHGVERIEATGQAFDPSLHDAVSKLDSDQVSVPTVQEELQSGFLMHDRLLRPAMVVVAVPTAGNGDDG